MRRDGRQWNQMRPFSINRHYQKFSSGSVLVSFGDTKVICSANIAHKQPPFLRDSNRGWLTAEYSLLPGSTSERTSRDISRGRLSGRSQEIQRLIGRALRAVVDFDKLGPRTILIDCDVLQADGGTRTASITGAWFALFDALLNLESTTSGGFPLQDYLAAVSVGIVDDKVYLDLDYSEDSQADVDLNLVMTGSGGIVEIQGTAEGTPLEKARLDDLVSLGSAGISLLIEEQKKIAGAFFHNHLSRNKDSR